MKTTTSKSDSVQPQQFKLFTPRFIALALLGAAFVLMSLGLTGCKGGPCGF